MNILKLLLFPLFRFLMFNNISINLCIDNIEQCSNKIRHRQIRQKFQPFRIFNPNARVLNCHFDFKWDLDIFNDFQNVIFGGTMTKLSNWKSSFHKIKLGGLPFFFLFWGDKAIIWGFFCSRWDFKRCVLPRAAACGIDRKYFVFLVCILLNHLFLSHT